MRTDHRDAGSLADRLRSGPLHRDELEQLAADLLAMLASLHANGTPHRDLTPASVRLDSSARLHSSKIGAQRGPSAAADAADVSADLHACGTVLAAAAGPDASAPVLVLIGMLTAPEPDLRPASAAEALNLLGVTGSAASLPAPAPPMPPAPRAAVEDVPTEAMPFPPTVTFPPLVDSRPMADTPALVEPVPTDPASAPAAYPRLRRGPSRRVLLAGLAGVTVLAVLGGVLFLGGGGNDPAEVPPPAQAPLSQQLDDLDGVIDILGE